MAGGAEPNAPGHLETDGGAAHGTGLRLVAQIAAVHGGNLRFDQGKSQELRVSILLPIDETKADGR